MFKSFIKKIFKFLLSIVILQILVLALEDDLVFYPLFFFALYIWLSFVHRIEEGRIMYNCFRYINGSFWKLCRFVLFLVVYFNMTMSYLNFLDYLSNRFALIGDLMIFVEYDQTLYEIYFYSICWMSLCLTFHLCHRNSVLYDSMKRINRSIRHYIRFVLFFRFFSHNIIFFTESPHIMFAFSEALFTTIHSRAFLHNWLLVAIYYISLRCTLHTNRKIFPRLNKYTAKCTSMLVSFIKFLLVWLFFIYNIFYFIILFDFGKWLLSSVYWNDRFFVIILCFVLFLGASCTLHVCARLYPRLYRCFKVVNYFILRLALVITIFICLVCSIYVYICIHDLMIIQPYLPEYLKVLRNGTVLGQHYSSNSLRAMRLVVSYLFRADSHGTANSMHVFYSEVCFMFNKDFVHDTSKSTLSIFKLEANYFLSKYFHGSVGAIDTFKIEAYRYISRGLHGSAAALKVFKTEANYFKNFLID